MLKFVLCDVLLIFVASATVIDECPELCQCHMLQGRAKCTKITEIPPVSPRIWKLILTDNAIKNIKRSDFKYNSLTHLSIDHNKIDSIDDDAFVDLSELKVLNLSNNRLRLLNKNIFRNNKKLTHLYMDNNPKLEFLLTDLPPTIQHISMANTNAIMPHDAIQKLTDLLSYNGQFCLKRDCSHLTQLNVKVIKDIGSDSPTTDATQNIKEDILPSPESSEMMDDRNLTSCWNYKITIGILGLLLILMLFWLLITRYQRKATISATSDGTLPTKESREPSDKQLLDDKNQSTAE